MAKRCETCGYQTKDDQQEICPFCGAGLQHSENATEETIPEPMHSRSPGIPIAPLLKPLFFIAIAGAALVYILLAPEQVGKQIRQWTEVLETKEAEVMDSLKNADQGKTDAANEGEKTATDPSGNEILTDFEVPGVSVQPEYVLADSARSAWTVTTLDDNLNLREGPGTEYGIVGKLDAGTQVVGCGYSTEGPSNWIVVEVNGQYGWACTDYLQQNG